MYENNSIETMQWTSLANVHKWNPTKRQTRDTYVHIAHTRAHCENNETCPNTMNPNIGSHFRNIFLLALAYENW